VKSPWGGGDFCTPDDKEQIEACSTGPCVAVVCANGTWGEWLPWAPCSRSCEGGVTFRTRPLGQMPTDCGFPPSGKDRETMFCNLQKQCHRNHDCEFTAWGDWSDCSVTCNGIKRRARRIGIYGEGKGKYCVGGLKETVPCNPGPSEEVPMGCLVQEPLSCQLTDWSPWTACTVTCSRGEHVRHRKVALVASSDGEACKDGGLSQVQECGGHACPGPAPVNCKFGDWEDWGACSKCGGQMKRIRSVVAYPAHGGKGCDLESNEETASCPRQCHKQQFCSWGGWEAWGGCTALCGKGKRSRRRYLHFSANPQEALAPATLAMAEYSIDEKEEWWSNVPSMHELLASFVCGCVTFFLAYGVFRGLSANRRRRAALVAPSTEFARVPIVEAQSPANIGF